jgi:hypothetical protein
MRQVREIIRLKLSASIPTREIARRLGVAASTVRETLRRLEGAGLGWPLAVGMSDSDLEAALYANHGTKRGHRRHTEPDWPTVHRELKRKHVTLVIVWDHLGNPTGVIAVGLVDPRRKGCMHVACLDTDSRKSNLDEPSIYPLRQWPCL